MVTNAGGVNPTACATALSKMAAEQGVELSVAMVTGDNLMDKVAPQDLQYLLVVTSTDQYLLCHKVD